MELYICKRLEDVEEGEMVMAYGHHVVQWDKYRPMGDPTYVFVPAPNGVWHDATKELPPLEDAENSFAVIVYPWIKPVTSYYDYTNERWECSDTVTVQYWTEFPEPPEYA